MSLDKKVQSPKIYFDNNKKIWIKSDGYKFDYSDGDRHEAYIKRVISSAQDKSSTSKELVSYIKSWPSEYHLSDKRAQLFSVFDFDRRARVLEVGCGCGAITRFLGEEFDQVTAIEGSERRAEIAANRVSDLPSVDILSAPFQDIRFTEPFDLIFCVGVLEYSPSFVGGKNPFSEIIEKMASFLSPNGTLLIAIENQFGLKYFSGAREDHTDRQYEGIEGYPHTGHKVKTFGKEALLQLAKGSFETVDIFYPFPDYKLPDLLLSEELFKQFPSFNFGELVGQFPAQAKYYKDHLNIDPTLAWYQLGQNKLISELANSFLLCCHKGENHHAPARSLFTFYSPNRSSDNRMRTDGIIVENKLVTRKAPLNMDISSLVNSQLNDTPWFDGISLSQALFYIVKNPNVSIQDLIDPIKNWVTLLANDDNSATYGHTLLPGEHIDLIPRNIICGDISDLSTWHVIDQEWVFPEKVPISFVIFRGLLHFFNQYNLIQKPSLSGLNITLYKLLKNIAQNIFQDYHSGMIREFINLESSFQKMVNPGVNQLRVKLSIWRSLLR